MFYGVVKWFSWFFLLYYFSQLLLHCKVLIVALGRLAALRRDRESGGGNAGAFSGRVEQHRFKYSFRNKRRSTVLSKWWRHHHCTESLAALALWPQPRLHCDPECRRARLDLGHFFTPLSLSSLCHSTQWGPLRPPLPSTSVSPWVPRPGWDKSGPVIADVLDGKSP